MAIIFFVVVGGIYMGWFSPTEAASIGAFGVGLLAIILGGMRWNGFYKALLRTAQNTAFIFLILLGAELFGAALALSHLQMETA